MVQPSSPTVELLDEFIWVTFALLRALVQRDKFMKHSMDFFNEALKIVNNNVYAAIGLGAVLGEMGRYEDSRTVFYKVQVKRAMCSHVASDERCVDLPTFQVRDLCQHLPCVRINLGTLALKAGQFASAATLVSRKVCVSGDGGNLIVFLALLSTVVPKCRGIKGLQQRS